ncbi:hypothetical protein OF83DRAFT_1094908, partial [Amylostereum chailletii]
MHTFLPTADKGKAKEEDYWNPGWWQFSSLAEHERRPVTWSGHSTILFAHPSQPLVCARLFPSSRQFTLPPPPLVLTPPPAYSPPTIISGSPDEQHLFAYFPSQAEVGVACIWKRSHVDEWIVQDCWSLPVGKGIIAATWLGHPREWVTDSTGKAVRPPQLGPATPLTSLTLILVARDMQIHACFLYHGNPKLKVISCSLSHPDETSANVNKPSFTNPSGPEGVQSCTLAAIGLAYNESSLLVATNSRTVPNSSAIAFPSLDITLPGLSDQFITPELSVSQEWDHWGDESVIEVCEVRCGNDGINMHLTTAPLPPLQCPLRHLNQLQFVAVNPRLANQTMSYNSTDGVKIHLAAAFANFGDYSSPPTTELLTFSFKRNVFASKPSQPAWLVSSSSRSFNDDVLAFIANHHPNSRASGLVIGTIHKSLYLPRKKHRLKEIPIGNITILSLPTLENDEDWQPAPFIIQTESLLRDLPFSIATSPNGVLACSISSTSCLSTSVSIHSFPRLSPHDPFGLQDEIDSLVASLRSRKSPSDIVHHLSLPLRPILHVESVLLGVLAALETANDGLRDVWLLDLFGVIIEVYRSRSSRVETDAEKYELHGRWKTALDLCTMHACHDAFVSCKERENGDLDAIWPLVGLCGWFVRFLEELLRECILMTGDTEDAKLSNQEGASSIPNIFLHIMHPDHLASIRLVLADVIHFYEYLSRHHAIGENSQLAKNVLLDIVEYSGIDLPSLEAVFEAIGGDFKDANGDALRQSVACCRPVSSLSPILRQIVNKIAASDAVDKPRLFIRPTDLVSGIGRVQSGEISGKEEARDVITQGVLLTSSPFCICVRCGGKTQVVIHSGPKHKS